MKKLILLFTIFISITILSCASDDDNEEFILTVTTEDVEFTIDENPTNGFEIGTVSGSTNQGNVTFSVLSQTPDNAFAINSITGKLTVLSEALFDFETSPTITGIVEVENGEVSNFAEVLININDVDENSFIGDVFLTTQEEINAFGANNYEIIDGNLTIQDDPSVANIVFTNALSSITKIKGVFTINDMKNWLDVPNFDNITSVGGIVITNNWGILGMNSLENITSNSGSITITNNGSLGSLCGLRPLLQNGDFAGTYTVSSNFYNPTQQEIIDGDCSGF